MPVRFIICILVLLIASVSAAAQPPRPAAGEPTGRSPHDTAHAHNDYLHPRPLHDAVSHGFCSVEADVFLIDGQLLVAHSRLEIVPSRSLRALYLDPLRERVRQFGGSVYGDKRRFTLLIDFKAEGEKCYQALDALLGEYPELFGLLSAEDPESDASPVMVIISGDRPIEAIRADASRRVGIDGRLSDLQSQLPASLMPLISDQWGKHFSWKGAGDMSEEERQKLASIVAQVHARQRRIRFWGAPDNEATWRYSARPVSI